MDEPAYVPDCNGAVASLNEAGRKQALKKAKEFVDLLIKELSREED